MNVIRFGFARQSEKSAQHLLLKWGARTSIVTHPILKEIPQNEYRLDIVRFFFNKVKKALRRQRHRRREMKIGDE